MTPAPLTPIERDDAFVQSSSALVAARCGDWERAVRTVEALAEQYDGEGVQILLLGLADTLLIRLGAPPRPDQTVALMWVDPDRGPIFNADDVSRPEIRWAGRFIAARAAGDNDTCAALVNSCANEDEYSRSVFAVLETVATTLNAMTAAG
jgi:hypothetical protein